jgi:DNA-binding IclR family transcriptional regulator
VAQEHGVGELVQWGALDRDAGGRYHVGLRLWEVAQNAGRQLRDTARPFLQDLFSLTQETAHLAVREGHEALYIDRVYSSRRAPRASRVGGRLPLHATAVGKVLLAYEEPWVREAYLRRGR